MDLNKQVYEHFYQACVITQKKPQYHFRHLFKNMYQTEYRLSARMSMNSRVPVSFQLYTFELGL